MARPRRATARAIATVLSLGSLLHVGTAMAQQEEAGFQFGSYGRIRAATDLRGGGPQYGSFVAHGSRLDLPPYLELELRWTRYPEEDLRVRVVNTLAIAGDPFHYTGNFDAQVAVRNMYVDVRGVGLDNLSLWAGARMYRGDDIYLLDFWPLDNLNTVGGGAGLDIDPGTRVQMHVGMNRLLDGAFQYQERQSPAPSGVGSVAVATLDRPKTIGSTKITQFFSGFNATKGVKASLYAEGHYLPSGIVEDAPTRVEPSRELPSDTGFVVGAQATAYGFGDRFGHAHLFLRYAQGIAAYGELGTPFGLNPERRSSGASELVVATGANFELDRFAIMMGAYARRFDDAAEAEFSENRFWEGIVSLRPTVYTTEHTGISAEASYQFRNPNVLDDLGRHRVPGAARLSVIPFVTPFGWGSYTRPILFAVYTATLRNEPARELYAPDDPRSERSTEHYLGLGAEWWFNSSSYP